MALASRSSKLIQAVGSYTEFAAGVDAQSGTAVTVSVPQLLAIHGVVTGGNTSTTAPYVDAVSGSSFTLTKASGDVVSWIAWGVARV
jgi:hypothetical protein